MIPGAEAASGPADSPASNELHPVLARILRKEGISPQRIPEILDAWHALLARVSNTLVQGDQDRYTQEHALEVVSEEMRVLHDELRSASESQLARERGLLHAVMSSVGDGLCVLDATGTITFANAQAERLLKAAPGGLAGRRGWDFVGDRVPTFCQTKLTAGEACRGRTRWSGVSTALPSPRATRSPPWCAPVRWWPSSTCSAT